MMGRKRNRKMRRGLIFFLLCPFNLTKENTTLASLPWKDGLSHWVSFEPYPKWAGSSKYIYVGASFNVEKFWTRTAVVVRTFKNSGATHDDWSYFCRCSREAKKLVRAFNNHLRCQGIHIMVVLNNPALVVMDNVSEVNFVTRLLMRFDKHFSEDEVVAFEELIKGDFRTFIDDAGKVVKSESEILDTLCHFSYHYSNGKYIMTNLKGVKNGPDNEDKPNTFCLTTPMFHSKTNMYGSTDRGQSGMQEFFKTHHCSALCQNFLTPARPVIQPTAPPYELIYEQTNQETEGPFQINHAALPPPPSYEESEFMYQKRFGE